MLTLKGNKGKKTFVKEDYSWSFTGGDVLSFLTYHVLENNTSIIKGSSVKTDIIYIDGSVSDGSVSNVCIYLEPDDQPFKINSTNSIEVENITYEYFGTEEGLKDGRNIYWLFGIPEKEIYIQQQKEESEKYDVEEQDPERTVTKVKGVMKDGSVSGYKITFIAEIDVSTSMSDMPKWYTSLGDNVKATLVGFMRTIDGEEVRSYTMIRFSGSKDSVWFDNDTTMPWKKDEGKPITVDTTYKSLISFDGTEEVYNSVSHDNMSTRMQFTNDENMEVETITLGIGPVDITVKAEDIKYIGGGKATYEKLW